MAHYDCKECGHTLGIDWGVCTNCTPDEYFELMKCVKKIYAEAVAEWDKASLWQRETFIAQYVKANDEEGHQVKINKMEKTKPRKGEYQCR